MLMTKAAYAAQKGFNKAYLSKKSVVAMIAPAMKQGEDGSWKIDSELADKIFEENKDPSREKRRGKKQAKTADKADGNAAGESQPDASYTAARAARENIKLESEQLDLLARKGKTLSRDGVEGSCAAAGQLIREHLQARNRRLAEKAATMTDAREIKVMLDEDDRTMLQGISDDLVRKLFKGDPEPSIRN